MTLSTHPEDRREMVRALSERLQTPAIYLRTPTYAFRIGKLTVNRDGSIASEDEALLEKLRAHVEEAGYPLFALSAASHTGTRVAMRRCS